MVICAGHNHAPPQRNLDSHLLAPQPGTWRARGQSPPEARCSTADSSDVQSTAEAVPALDRRSLVADQYQPLWRPGENPRCAGRQSAAAEARASRASYDPAGDFGRRHLDELSPDPGAQGTIWSIGHSPMTCCGAAAAWACP